MNINKKVYFGIIAFLIAVLLLLILIVKVRKTQIPSTPDTNIVTPTLSTEFLTIPPPIPTSIIPTEIMPGSGVGEDGIPYPSISPTSKINDFFNNLNFFTVYAATDPNASTSQPLELLRKLLEILFSFNTGGGPGPGGTGPTNPPNVTPPNPTITYMPGEYGPPPNKPYYNPTAGCYNQQELIQVYANGVSSPSTCWNTTKQAVEWNMTSVNMFGLSRALPVHRKVLAAFSSVDKELRPYQVSGSKYKFAQGDYEFTPDTWTYAFRCNVNASGSKDLCSPSCVLSLHSFGIAIDVNPATNANGSTTFDMPPEVVAAFENNGFRWGGRYKDVFGATIDAMHFEYLDEVCR